MVEMRLGLGFLLLFALFLYRQSEPENAALRIVRCHTDDATICGALLSPG
jgi:hypothetical protein